MKGDCYVIPYSARSWRSSSLVELVVAALVVLPADFGKPVGCWWRRFSAVIRSCCSDAWLPRPKHTTKIWPHCEQTNRLPPVRFVCFFLFPFIPVVLAATRAGTSPRTYSWLQLFRGSMSVPVARRAGINPRPYICCKNKGWFQRQTLGYSFSLLSCHNMPNLS